MKLTLFYSWQSDLPSSTNRGFIEQCLKQAIKKISPECPINLEPTLERDVKGRSGSPNIADTIFDKIANCDIFVADVSIIGELTNEDGTKCRPSPNPNVLLELGYAIRTVTWDFVILVVNEAYGKLDKMPFDLRNQRMMTYQLTEGRDKTDAQSKLIRGFEDALRMMIVRGDPHSRQHILTVVCDAEAVIESIRTPLLDARWSTEEFNQGTVTEDLNRLSMTLSPLILGSDLRLDQRSLTAGKHVIEAIDDCVGNGIRDDDDEFIRFTMTLLERAEGILAMIKDAYRIT